MVKVAANRRSEKSKFRFIDLFAGIGGMRDAFESLGGSCEFSSEWDDHARRTYAARFGDEPRGDSITEIEASEIPEFDVLLAGFPCQPFSSIGKREGFDHPTQGTLFYDVRRIIAHHEPAGFLLENVPGLVTHNGGDTLAVIEETLTELGYGFDHKILDAARFGVPQHRKRIYIVGVRGDSPGRREFNWPSGSDVEADVGPFIEKLGKKDDRYSISTHLQRTYIRKIEDGRPQILKPREPGQGATKTLVASYHKIQRLTGTFVEDGSTGLRLLTESECKRIMGFPNSYDFNFPVSRTQMYRQLGNSVAIPVVKVVGEMLIKEIADCGR